MMRIKEINIKNFRGIKDLTLRLSNFTVLIGKNGVGKSSILHALNFFKQQKYNLKIEDYYDKDLESIIEVSITFFELNREELEEFQHYIQNEELKVIKIAKGNKENNNPNMSQEYHGIRKMHSGFIDIRNLSDAKMEQKKLYHKIITQEKYNSLSTVSRADQIEEQLLEWEKTHLNELKLIMDDGKFFGWPGVGTGKLGKYMEFFFIPAVHEYSEEEKAEGSSYLNELLDLTIRKTLIMEPKLIEFMDSVKNKYHKYIDEENIPKTDLLNQKLSERIHQFAPECEVFIKHQPGEVKFLPTKYETELKEFGFQGPISFLGHGVQRSFFFTLLQLLGEQKVLEKYEKQENDNIEDYEINTQKTNLILLIIEEPELYQNPNRIKLIKQLFKNLTSINEDSEFQFQIICSSHSPYLIDISSVENIRILRKLKQNDEYLVTTKHVNLDKIAKIIKDVYEFPDTKRYDKSTLLSRLISIMTIELSEGFFSDKVVLVEGLEDKAVIQAFNSQLSKNSFEEYGISIIPVYGKNNLDRPTLIFKDLDIPTFIIFDTDSNKRKEKNKNIRTNSALRKIMDDKKIGNPFEEKVEKTWASLDPTLTLKIRNSLGEEYYYKEMNKLREKYEFPKIEDCQKNFKIMLEFITKCYQDGKSIPIFEKITQNIHAL